MSKKQKKKDWSLYSKPYLGSAPVAPLLEYKQNVFTRLGILYTSEVKLSELKLPEGVVLSDIVIRSDHSHGYDGDCSVDIEYGTYEEKIDKNTFYKDQLKDYNKRLEGYKLRKESFKDELKEWKLWCKEENARQLEKQIQNAELFLKKHGKLNNE